MGRSSALFWQFAVTSTRNAGFLLITFLEIAVVAILMFGVDAVLSDGVPNEFKIFNHRFDALVLHTSRLVPSISSLVVAGLTAIFIVGFSGTFLDLIEDPLLPVYLAGGAGRSSLILTRALAVLFSFAVQLGIFGAATGVTLSAKTGLELFLTPIVGAGSVWIGLMLALSFAAVLSMVVPERTAVIVCTLFVYFGVAPAVKDLHLALHPVLGILHYILPPAGEVSSMTHDALGGNGLNLNISLHALAASAYYTVVAIMLFRRKDL
jgi:hypothetical protein